MEFCRKIAFAVVYNSNNASILIFLVRTLTAMKNAPRLKIFMTSLLHICWITFGILLVAGLVVQFGFRGEDLLLFNYYAFSGFFVFSLTSLVFTIFVMEVKRRKNVSVLRSQKLLSLFFIFQMIGQLNYSVYYFLKITFTKYMINYQNLGVEIFLYGHGIFSHFIPALLVVLMIHVSTPTDTQSIRISTDENESYRENINDTG
eukprot:TRINITY_DN2301_c0_g1_i2.p3 TRINITY_DN2301_c0_g1~~TRINITY_DN2301_c0_g1_i2.p3  ORF type:complete len:203 (+),score=1.60 TRINITY_DN2301_c0_g1_i2:666-1274(+)